MKSLASRIVNVSYATTKGHFLKVPLNMASCRCGLGAQVTWSPESPHLMLELFSQTFRIHSSHLLLRDASLFYHATLFLQRSTFCLRSPFLSQQISGPSGVSFGTS